MKNYDYFELHRQSDDLIYQFDRKLNSDGEFGYKRRDQDLWITWKYEFGWIAFDEESQSITGRAWEVMPEAQIDHPPEGIWVSKKGIKSYVYELKYTEPKD